MNISRDYLVKLQQLKTRLVEARTEEEFNHICQEISQITDNLTDDMLDQYLTIPTNLSKHIH